MSVTMKKIILSAILLIAFFTATFAQKGTQWATIKTPNLRCWECKKRLEDYMAREIAQPESGITKLPINL